MQHAAHISEDVVDGYLDRISLIEMALEEEGSNEESIQIIRGIATTIESLLMSMHVQQLHQCHSTTANGQTSSSIHRRGRPTLPIDSRCLIALCEFGVTIKRMAQILCVSESTIQRRLQEMGVSIRMQYSPISDSELDELVETASMQHPTWGYRIMQGHLSSLGYRIQQNRVRESMLRVDPLCK